MGPAEWPSMFLGGAVAAARMDRAAAEVNEEDQELVCIILIILTVVRLALIIWIRCGGWLHKVLSVMAPSTSSTLVSFVQPSVNLKLDFDLLLGISTCLCVRACRSAGVFMNEN